jgi:hypothetical protein
MTRNNDKSKKLNKLEHSILSRHVDDVEPISVLYLETKRDFGNISVEIFTDALLKIKNLGFSDIGKLINQKWNRCLNINKILLEKYLVSDKHPDKSTISSLSPDDYYVAITPKGKIEESKKIYDIYYQIL